MNVRTNLQSSSHSSKENLPPSSKADAVPVPRATQRTVLGVLSENEQRGGRSLSQVSERVRSFHFTSRNFTFQLPLWQLVCSLCFSLQGSQLSKHSSVSDSSQLVFPGAPSSSSYDVHVEEACEVVLTASGQEVVSDSCHLDTETPALQNEDLRLLLDLSSSEFYNCIIRPVSCSLPNCGSLFQILLCSLMNPWCQRRCCVVPTMQWTFTST